MQLQLVTADRYAKTYAELLQISRGQLKHMQLQLAAVIADRYQEVN